MQLQDLNIAIIGGGIGGMAAGAALARRGARVVLYEQAHALAEVGAGLQISPNGQAVLWAIGAGQAAGEAATVSSGTRFHDGTSGRALAHVPGPHSGPTWYMHRADLLAALVEAAQTAGVEIELSGHRVPGSLEADLVIAADGVGSTWRTAVDGPDRPQFTGQVAWRALVPCAPDLLPTQAQLYMGSRAHIVIYPLRQGRLANIVAVEERHGWIEEGWNLQGSLQEFRDRFANFHGQAGDVVAKAKQVYQWALHTRPVARQWHKDNVVLLGDAAHPTLPFLAQGACMALEDAAVLTGVLQAAKDIPSALARYQSLRADRARRIVAIAKGNAWRFHMPRPWAWGAHLALKIGAGALARRLEWVYDYDATKVAAE